MYYPPFSNVMTEAKWRRLAGLWVLVTLALHGANAVGYCHDPGLKHDCVFSHFHYVLFLQPHLPVGDVPVPVAAGLLPEEPEQPVVAAVPRLHPSRGPPA